MYAMYAIYVAVVTIMLVFVLLYIMHTQDVGTSKVVCMYVWTERQANELACKKAHRVSTCDLTLYTAMNLPLWSNGMQAYAHNVINAQVWRNDCAYQLAVRPNQNQQPKLHFVLCGDETFPTDCSERCIRQIYSHAEHVYAQNLDRSGLTAEQNKITTCVPIGLDLHTLAVNAYWGVEQAEPHHQYARLRALRSAALHVSKRKRKVLITWLLASRSSDRFVAHNYKSRPQLYKECLHNLNFELGTGSRDETWLAMSKHAFVYSPIGNGFDCHRTWEALALGCIVIAQRNPTLEAILAEHPHLPVCFCDDPATIDNELLDRLVAEYNPIGLEMLSMPTFVAPRYFINNK